MDLADIDIKRAGEKSTSFSNFTSLNSNGLSIANSNNNLSTIGLIRNEELSKMFPTPPSLEQHTNSSPGGVCGNISDHLLENIEIKQEGFGSPHEEPIEVSLSECR